MSDKNTTQFRLEIRGEGEIRNPTPQEIKLAIDSISPSDDDPFLILDKGADGMTYVQAMLEENSLWTLEFQDGSLQRHFEVSDVSKERVTDVFLAFARGEEAWRTSVEWRQIDIERQSEIE